MGRCLALCTLFCLLLPEFLSAQERRLKGVVIRVGEHGEKIPEANITVKLRGEGPTKTNSFGEFRIFLRDIFKPGENVTLVIDKPDWRIRYSLGGDVRIPADLAKEVVEVELLPKGSKLFLTPDQIEKLISDMAEQSKLQVTPEGWPQAIDFSQYIKNWAVKYGFSAQQAKTAIDKWIQEIEATRDDQHRLGLAQTAKKNFGEASKLFTESAEHNVRELEDIEREDEERRQKSETSSRGLCSTIASPATPAVATMRLIRH
jgi:hypothetical protein